MLVCGLMSGLGDILPPYLNTGIYFPFAGLRAATYSIIVHSDDTMMMMRIFNCCYCSRKYGLSICASGRGTCMYLEMSNIESAIFAVDIVIPFTEVKWFTQIFDIKPNSIKYL